MQKGNSRVSKGFTIVEIIVVIAIIGVLSTIVFVSYKTWQNSVIITTLKSDLNGVASAMENARTFGNTYPITVPSTMTPSKNITLTGGSTDGGKAYCVNAVSSEDSSIHYYINSIIASAGANQGECANFVMVGYYPLNGNTNDYSGNSHNGIIFGPIPAMGQNGVSNNAYSFSGASTQYIDTGYTYPLTNFTVSLWAYPNGTGPNGFDTIISNTRDCCGTYYGFQIEYTKTTPYNLTARLWHGSSSLNISYSGLTLNAWNYLTLVYNGNTLSLYKNNTLVASGTYSGTLGTPTYDVFIGKMGAIASGYSFGGSIDDVRIYNGPLSTSEIQALYTAGAQ